MEEDPHGSIDQRSRQGGKTDGAHPARDQALVLALASYLVTSRDKADVRKAIGVWCHDVVNAGLQPEHLLVDFKAILDGMRVADLSPDIRQRLVDRREMISMCIEEYYR